ncbi:MAG: antitoxin Xre/MbcA/ParS toxin-binding domain-containing protein [Marinobacter sp.]|uniref:antitoxin Xre/MbcA/ParS toxin-binding domain-containing protein n=1 Tax=Marinobacter sp. AC-23 TaxID=1879031 RepID=UPI0008DE2CF9|nr:antitoxin Xre/MbcA/ParS toxin-binding domain-containing protein [Marinobacter sp. AC-23]OHY80739.1 hypothetical protein BCA33_13300 [Marinobacter sp. AC-23]
MTVRKRYNLDELIAQCAPNTPASEAFQGWEQAPMIGTEHAITRYALDVIAQAVRVWESREQALEWLQGRVSALDDERPCDLLGTQEGCRRICSALSKIEHGDFS